MKWVTALQLQQWSETIGARTAFPGLIGDLIRASAETITSFRFPSGDKGQVRGFDGWLEADAKSPFVPDGRSLWEFGITPVAASKMEGDLEKRSQSVDKATRLDTTFVFATPHTWDNPNKPLQAYINELKQKYEWKDIRYLDGSTLEAWLDQCPAVAARYARTEWSLVPQHGLRSIEEYWQEYSNRYAPALSEQVLLSGRESEASTLVANLTSGSGKYRLAADAPDEVIAFAIAAVRTAPPALRYYIESRTLIVDTPEAARFASQIKGAIYFPRGLAATESSGMLASVGPTLLAVGRDSLQSEYKYLPRPSFHELGTAIESMGFDRDKARELAKRCGRSVTILARQIPSGNAAQPEWVQHAADLVPAVLAGGWDTLNSLDLATVQKLVTSEGGYERFERLLRKQARLQDPPIELEGAVWHVRAPVDAFLHVGPYLTQNDLEALAEVATEVFSQPIEPPKDDDRFSLERAPTTHSSWLRDGIATTVLQIATLGSQAGLAIPGIDPQTWVDKLVGRLLGLETDPRVVASLRNQLPLLMEAAPRPLLAALEHLLEGEDTKAALFWPTDPMFAPSSPHIYLLWGLELLAWDPLLLPRVTRLLGRLVPLAVDAKGGNTPLASLRSIFLSWSPNTFATASQRTRALDGLIDVAPDVAWSVLKELLPKAHDTNMPTTKPRFREASASNAEVLTYGKVWTSQKEIIERFLTLSSTSTTRILDVVASMYNWDDDNYGDAVRLIEHRLVQNQGREQLWSAVRDLVAHHKTFADTEWALKGDRLAKLESLVAAYQPTDVLQKVRWLFDDWSPRVDVAIADRERTIERLRTEALLEVQATLGDKGIVSLAKIATRPETVGNSIGAVFDNIYQYLSAIETASTNDGLRSFAQAISGVADRIFPSTWPDTLRQAILRNGWAPDYSADLVIPWTDDRSTWNFVSELGPDFVEVYWKRKRPYLFEGGIEDFLWAIDTYLEFDRPSAALTFTYRRLREVPSQTLVRILSSLVSEINAEGSSVDSLTSYNVEEAIDELTERSDVEITTIARLEYAYLPWLRHSKRPLAIHRLLATDPAFFMSLIESVFRSEDDDGTNTEIETSGDIERKRAKWSADYNLLSEFHTLPGLTAIGVDYDALQSWITRVRELAIVTKRSAITDQYIGHLLAHSPEGEKGVWPHPAVCRLIEEIASEEIEAGFRIECFNKRGVYTKSPYEGGAQERDLAERYHNWSVLTVGFPRTSSVLEEIARGWESDAEQADVKARQDKMRE